MKSGSVQEMYDLIKEKILLDGTTQSVKYGETFRDRSGRLDIINFYEMARPQNFIMGCDETKLGIKIIRESINDDVRKRQKRIPNVAGDGEEHSIIWGLSITMESATFMGKNFQNNQNSIRNIADLTLQV